MATTGSSARRILVVDDEPLVCDSIRRMLGIDGHQVEMANSGPQALTLFHEGKFDLIITDYEMPEMKGDKLTERIKSLDAHQPVLMLTAHVEALLSAGNPSQEWISSSASPSNWRNSDELSQRYCRKASRQGACPSFTIGFPNHMVRVIQEEER